MVTMSLLDNQTNPISVRCTTQSARDGVTAAKDIPPAADHDNWGQTPQIADGANIRFIFGMARSGTSWLGKIFDSHPDVIYRHEPDIVLRETQFLTSAGAGEGRSLHDRTRMYLQALSDVRTLKSAGSVPIFPKNYQIPPARHFRLAIVYGLRMAEQLAPQLQWPQHVQLPDLKKKQYEAEPTFVIKSVSSCGRARAFMEALPGCRTIFIIRHPCGQVASMLRGIALGKFSSAVIYPSLEGRAKALGLTTSKYESLPLIDRLAWHWAILNQNALDELTGMPRVKVIRYRDLCASPLDVAQDVFEFAGISWQPQIAAFIEKSTHYHGPDRYYTVLKNSIISLNRWRTELSLEDQRRIIDIARQVPAGGMFLD